MALQLEKVLISDSVDVSCREILESAGISVDSRPGLRKDELISIIKVCHLDRRVGQVTLNCNAVENVADWLLLILCSHTHTPGHVC